MRLPRSLDPPPLLIALGAAVAGTAFAEGIGLTDRQLDKIKAIAKNRANKQINKRAPNLTVDDSAHLGAFGPSYYTMQSKHETLLNPLVLSEALQTVLEIEIEVPSQRSITGIATIEATAGGAGQAVNCSVEIDGNQGPIFTSEVPAASSRTISAHQTENVLGGIHTVLVECSESAPADVTVTDAELTAIAIPTGPPARCSPICCGMPTALWAT